VSPNYIATGLLRQVLDADRKLRVFETMQTDLAYDVGDPRATMSDNEMPPEWHEERAGLQYAVTYAAARFAGESPEIAACYADQPLDGDHLYTIPRVRFALSLQKWSIAVEACPYCQRKPLANTNGYFSRSHVTCGDSLCLDIYWRERASTRDRLVEQQREREIEANRRS
jgi:hypothetical protein